MKKLFFVSLAVCVAVGAIIAAYSARSKVDAQAAMMPFGGQILAVNTCCNGVAITVGPPNPGTFLYTAGSILYSYYNIYSPGAWVLGNASPGGVCLPLPLCFPSVPVEGTIIQVGTSNL